MPDRFTDPLVIAPATTQDAQDVSRLILGLRHSFLQEPVGPDAQDFLQTLGPSAIAAQIVAPNMRYFKALHSDLLAGVLGVRGGSHVFHFFVEPTFQGQGVGRALWQHFLSFEGRPVHARTFTVNSSVMAVPIYERLGFRATGPRVHARGIAYVPMRLDAVPAT